MESKRNLLIVGESGTSKSTVLKEVICDYLDQGYLVLYNYGTEIGSNDVFIKFIEGLLKGGKKVLVATDDAHNVHTAPIFYIMDQLTRFELNQNLRFVFSARLPDYDFFVNDVSIVEEKHGQSIRKFRSMGEAFRYELPNFNLDEVRDFISMYGDFDMLEQTDETCESILEDTKGVAIMVKFAVLGEGLKEDVVNRYNRYICNDSKSKDGKIETMLACSLLRIKDFDVNDELLKKIRLYPFALMLDRATLYRHSGRWDAIHRIWNSEFLSFMFDKENELRLCENKEHLWNAFDKVLQGDEKALVVFASSIISEWRTWMPVVEVESEIRIRIDDPTCNLSPQTKSKLWYYTGDAFNMSAFFRAVKSNRQPLLGKALECYNKAIELDPTYALAWFRKGSVLISLKGLQDFFTWCHEGIRSPYKGTENTNLFDETLECYNKAIELDPNLRMAWLRKGSVLVYTYRFDEALECYNKAIDINPTIHLYWKDKKDLLERMERFDEALECYNKIIELDPTYSDYWEHKGSFLERIERFDDALECYNKAIELDPNDEDYWYNRARLEARQGNIEAVLADLNEAKQINEDCVKLALEDEGFEKVKYDTRFLALVS